MTNPTPVPSHADAGTPLPCPFCGEAPVEYDNFGSPDWTPADRRYRHPRTLLSAMCAVSSDRVLSLKEWNRRAPVPPDALTASGVSGAPLSADQDVLRLLKAVAGGDNFIWVSNRDQRTPKAEARRILAACGGASRNEQEGTK